MSPFLSSMRRFDTEMSSTDISHFGQDQMRAQFASQHNCTSGHVFGGNIAFFLALWGCAKNGITADTNEWGLKCRFKAPAPINTNFEINETSSGFSAISTGKEFATAVIEYTDKQGGPLSFEKPNFDVRFNGHSDSFLDYDLVLQLPESENWLERLYYMIAACDWGIWVLGQTYYPEASFVTSRLDINFKEKLPKGNLKLTLRAHYPNPDEPNPSNDRIDLVVEVYDSSERSVAFSGACLVNFDYTASKKPIALPKAQFPTGLF